MTDADSGEEDETFHSLAKEGTDSTDGPPLPAARVSSCVPCNDLQSLGRIAQQQHAHSHKKESELAAEAVKTQETFPRDENPSLARKQARLEKTSTSDEQESEMLREVEDRAQQLEAELSVMKEEKEVLQRQVFEARDECERTKRKVLVDAEKDKNLLVEENEHFHRTITSLESLLHEKDDAIKKQAEELRVVKDLHEASRESPNSLNSSSCTLEEKESDQLKAAKKALEESRELEQKAKQDLTESIQQMQKEQESRKEMMRELKQQHQEEVVKLKARARSSEDTERRWKANNQAVLAQKEEEVKHLNEKLDDASQEIGNLQVSACIYMWSDLHMYVRK